MFLAEPPQTAYDLQFRIGPIPVRVHPFFWLVTAVMGWSPENAISVFLWVGVVFVSILIHELGHVIAMMRYGESARVVLYAMGGLAIPDGTFRSSRSSSRGTMEQIVISFAGPAAGFLLAFVVVGLVNAFGPGVTFEMPNLRSPIFWRLGAMPNRWLAEVIFQLLFVNIFWGLMNLMPVFPLDGGQIARAFLISKDPYNGVRNSLQLSVITGIGIAIFGLMVMKDTYICLMFGALAAESYLALQQISGGGRRGPW